MTVTAVREIIDGRGATQRFGENVKCKRTFMVTVDEPSTSVSEISGSVYSSYGVRWLTSHPEFPAVYVTDIACSNDGDPLHYKVEATYDLIKPEDREPMPWDRLDKFQFSGSTTTGPAIVHYNDGFESPKLIVNSAGDPLEGAEKEFSQWQIQITGNRQAFPYATAMDYMNTVNSDTWSGFPPGTLKVQSISGQREVEQVNGSEVTYWTVTVDIAYRPEGFALKLWDIGFNEISGGRRKKILDQLKEPVSDPVALSGGVAKSAGSPPDMLTFKVYDQLPFTNVFTALPS
jgi:hypothetical protein